MTLPGPADPTYDTTPSREEPLDLAVTLARVTWSARALVPGVEHASISLRHPDGTLETVAPTDPIAVQADLVQNELEEGPCFDGETKELVTYAADLANELRWPAYGPKAAALGFHSQLAARLFDAGGTRACLNLYAIEPGAIDGSLESARALCCLAQVAVTQARDRESLVVALQSRELIGKAIGMVMERYDVRDDRAFSYLVRQSQTSNIKLREIAARLVARKPTG
jgi:hypothetical protein